MNDKPARDRERKERKSFLDREKGKRKEKGKKANARRKERKEKILKYSHLLDTVLGETTLHITRCYICCTVLFILSRAPLQIILPTNQRRVVVVAAPASELRAHALLLAIPRGAGTSAPR